jgi:hypothetical protein
VSDAEKIKGPLLSVDPHLCPKQFDAITEGYNHRTYIFVGQYVYQIWLETQPEKGDHIFWHSEFWHSYIFGTANFWEIAFTSESQYIRITIHPITLHPDHFTSGSLYIRITLHPDHFTSDQVNVRLINGVFLKFILHTFSSQSGGYYLIGTEVKLDTDLPVNIFRYE